MKIDGTHKLIPVTSFDRYADRLALDGLKTHYFRKTKIFPREDKSTYNPKTKSMRQ